MRITINKYKKMLSGYPKATLEDIRSVGYALVYGTERPSIDRKNDLRSLSLITKTLSIPQKQTQAIAEKMHSSWHIFEDNQLNKHNAKTLVEAVSEELGQSVSAFELVKKGGGLFIRFGKDKKLYAISDDVNARKAKLLIFLSDPSIGTRKTTESVFETILLPKDEGRQFNREEKKQVIINTLKEIQSNLSNAPKSFSLEWYPNAVALKIR